MTQKVEISNEVLLPEVTAMISEGHSIILPTKGNSMLPFIVGDRDSVLLEKPYSVKTGDIVLARLRSGHYVLHRIADISPDVITLRGDGNLNGTEQCQAKDICALAVRIIKASGRELDCSSARFALWSRRWSSLPRQVRRIYLGLYRRYLALMHRN